MNPFKYKILGNESKCWYCGCYLSHSNKTTDHFLPKHLGGRLHVYCCKACNKLKKDLTPLEFINKLKNLKNISPMMFLWQNPDYKVKPDFDRMINATKTLWDKIDKELIKRENENKSKDIKS